MRRGWDTSPARHSVNRQPRSGRQDPYPALTSRTPGTAACSADSAVDLPIASSWGLLVVYWPALSSEGDHQGWSVSSTGRSWAADCSIAKDTAASSRASRSGYGSGPRPSTQAAMSRSIAAVACSSSVGAGNATAIVTLVERVTRLTLLGYLPAGAHDAASVTASVVAALSQLPSEARLTLTWDQGKEMARHREIAARLGTTRIFFCDPHSPWQRPTNENTNGVLRDYFPKGSDLAVHTAEGLAAVQTELNERPRKVLDWDSPDDRMAKLLGTPVLRR